MHDLLIRGGMIVDGTGAEAREADVAIVGDRIVEIGDISTSAREEIDARGKLVTPGWVDVHTHYDGQATWDPLLSPSCWHGVTTAVMGNCGVGFAPVHPDRHEWLIGLMEGVEDIPGSALAEGIKWNWETFPEYLDALEKIPRALDIGTQVPHGAVRGYVMGERGAKNEPATADDITQMTAVVREGLEAGALGFSTSRTIYHRAVDGEPVPGTFAADDELLGIASALRDVGHGLFELAPAGVMGEDLAAPDKEIAWMSKVSAMIQRPVTFALIQHDADSKQWKRMLELCDQAEQMGANLVAQVGSRPTMLLMGLQTFHPFSERPSYLALAELPLEQRVNEMRKSEVRQRILSEESPTSEPIVMFINASMHKVFALGDPPDYEPRPEQSIQAQAEREGRSAHEVLYDALLELDGRQLLMFALLGYSDFNLDAVGEMLAHPRSAFGLGDGGAHCGVMCDASMTTYMLTHWVRDRERGSRLPLEWTVKKMTHDTATLFGLNDRGVLAPGYKADLNVIDFQKLRLDLPKLAFDLPAGARRLVQRAQGYDATILSGKVTFRDGESTGALPGRLLRGPQATPRLS